MKVGDWCKFNFGYDSTRTMYYGRIIHIEEEPIYNWDKLVNTIYWYTIEYLGHPYILRNVYPLSKTEKLELL